MDKTPERKWKTLRDIASKQAPSKHEAEGNESSVDEGAPAAWSGDDEEVIIERSSRLPVFVEEGVEKAEDEASGVEKIDESVEEIVLKKVPNECWLRTGWLRRLV